MADAIKAIHKAEQELCEISLVNMGESEKVSERRSYLNYTLKDEWVVNR